MVHNLKVLAQQKKAAEPETFSFLTPTVQTLIFLLYGCHILK